MQAAHLPRPGITSVLSLAAGSAALLSPAAQAAPGDPIGAPILVSTAATPAGLARAGNGAMVATYLRDRTLTARRFAADGAPQGPPITVAPAETADFGGDVAMDANGDFVVIWGDFDGNRQLLKARRYGADGNPQGAMTTVDAMPIRDLAIGGGPFVQYRHGYSQLAVDMNADGDFSVLWGEYRVTEVGNNAACKYLIGATCVDNLRESLKLRRFNASGAPVGAVATVAAADSGEVVVAALLNLSGGRQLVGADLTVRSDDSTVVAFSRYNTVGRQARGRLYTRTYGASLLPPPASEVGTGSDVFRAEVRVDSAADGSLVLAHRTISSDPVTFFSDCGISVDLLTAGGAPLAPRQRVDTVPGDTVCGSAPLLTMDAAGNHVVAWNSAPTRAQRYAVGGTALGGNFDLTPPSAQRFSAAFLASDAVGNFVVGYQLSGSQFVLQRYEGP